MVYKKKSNSDSNPRKLPKVPSDIDSQNGNNQKIEPNFKFLKFAKNSNQSNDIFKHFPNEKSSGFQKFKRNQKWDSNPGGIHKNSKTNLFSFSVHKRRNIQKTNDSDGNPQQEEIEDALMMALMPQLMAKHNNGSNASEEYCSEIVDQMRQSTNTVVDEMRQSRKEYIESTDNSTKQIVGGLKQLQSKFCEELSKIGNNNEQN
jgi:hypothetical protein